MYITRGPQASAGLTEPQHLDVLSSKIAQVCLGVVPKTCEEVKVQ